MSRYHSYINSSKEIILAYTGAEPFASFIKKYFSANKKFGSKDRKQVAHLCYCLYRLGKAYATETIEDRLLIALFLCSTESNDVLMNLKPDWNEKVKLGISEKIAEINLPFDAHQLFPFTDHLSDGIDQHEFALSHLIQPDLFLRIRPGQKEKVINKLNIAGLAFGSIGETCIALPNATKIEEIIVLNKEAVVQDYSSQRVGEMLAFIDQKPVVKVWDCCAASGGKAIMTYDLFPAVELAVSDIRNSILANLEMRFAEAGIKKYNSFVADLSDSSFVSHYSGYDLVIADVPCSGSGTWGRTPEQLRFFPAEKAADYSSLQKKIADNVIPYVKKGGFFLYITCSVFKKENEEVVAGIKEKPGLELIEMKLLKGYDVKADTMFAALFRKK